MSTQAWTYDYPDPNATKLKLLELAVAAGAGQKGEKTGEAIGRQLVNCASRMEKFLTGSQDQ